MTLESYNLNKTCLLIKEYSYLRSLQKINKNNQKIITESNK